MKKHIKLWVGILLGLAIVAVSGWYLSRHLIPVLQPAGEIGTKERNLLAFCALISVTIVVPVFGLLGYFAWKYREQNPRGRYSPELEGSATAETIWWLIPTALMIVISTITWRSSYALDPYKPISSNKKTLHVQVVALDWKWLFIYPDQHVASVNFAPVPVNTPLQFEITSDAVMTSFWVPQLGGQMYAMPGMSTQLNLEAAKTGTYDGAAANISGKGFAEMRFKVAAVNNDEFQSWMSGMQHLQTTRLDAASYAKLARPGTMAKSTYYSSVDPTLYDTIMMKYMMPMGNDTNLQEVAH